MIIKILWVVVAVIMGIFLGAIGSAIYEANYSDGLQLLPVGVLIKQLIPGMVIGAIAGVLFYKPVSIIGLFVLNLILSGDVSADIDVGGVEMPDISSDAGVANSIDCSESNQSLKAGTPHSGAP